VTNIRCLLRLVVDGVASEFGMRPSPIITCSIPQPGQNQAGGMMTAVSAAEELLHAAHVQHDRESTAEPGYEQRCSGGRDMCSCGLSTQKFFEVIRWRETQLEEAKPGRKRPPDKWKLADSQMDLGVLWIRLLRFHTFPIRMLWFYHTIRRFLRSLPHRTNISFIGWYCPCVTYRSLLSISCCSIFFGLAIAALCFILNMVTIL
jgi:hypothetical protein